MCVMLFLVSRSRCKLWFLHFATTGGAGFADVIFVAVVIIELLSTMLS